MNDIAKRGKKFSVYLLDLVTTFILTMSLFFIGESINTNTRLHKSRLNDLSTIEDETVKVVGESKLTYLKDDGYLAQVEDITKDYLVRQTFHSIDENKKNNDFFKETKDIDENSDSLYFYYKTFVIDYKDRFIDSANVMTLEEYVNKLFLESKNYENKIFVNEGYPYFTSETADKIYSYLVLNNNYNFKDLYDTIYNSYSTILQTTIDQYMENYQPYIDLANKYQSEVDKFYQIKIAILLSSYILSITIFYYVIPSIFKDGRSLFMKLFKLKAFTVDEKSIPWYSNVIRAIALFINYFFINSLISFIVLGGYSGFIFIFTHFFNVFN